MHHIKFNGPREVEGSYGSYTSCFGQAKVTLRFESDDSGNPLEVVCTLSEDQLPPALRDAVYKGIAAYKEVSGLLFGGMKITIVGAVVHHESPLGFRLAAYDAIKKTCEWARGLD